MIALGYDVVGVDLDRSVANQITGFKFIQGDFNRIELTPGFDLIVACLSLIHI